MHVETPIVLQSGDSLTFGTLTADGCPTAVGTFHPVHLIAMPKMTGQWQGGAFVLDDTPENAAAIAGKAVGDVVLYVSSAGYEFTSQSGATGLNSECIEPARITAISGLAVSLDCPEPLAAHSLGWLTDGENPELVDVSAGGRTFAVLDGVDITGEQVLCQPGEWMLEKSGVRGLTLVIDHHEGEYGLGGNLMVDSSQTYGSIVAHRKAWDIAGRSARSSYAFTSMTVGGDGSVSTTGKIGENSTDCHVTGAALRFPNLTTGDALAFITCRDCSDTIDFLDLPLHTGIVLRFGLANAPTLVGGGECRTSGNTATLKAVNAPQCSHFVRIYGGAGVTIEDNVIADDCAFYGNPTSGKAVEDDGVRTYIGGYYENGDIDLSEATDATVNVRLGTGQVVGATPSTCASLTVNGVSIPVT